MSRNDGPPDMQKSVVIPQVPFLDMSLTCSLLATTLRLLTGSAVTSGGPAPVLQIIFLHPVINDRLFPFLVWLVVFSLRASRSCSHGDERWEGCRG